MLRTAAVGGPGHEGEGRGSKLVFAAHDAGCAATAGAEERNASYSEFVTSVRSMQKAPTRTPGGPARPGQPPLTVA